jgi:hypothetical protein
LGCFLRRGNRTYILSNNHILADTNRAQIGDPILQPGLFDGGVPPQDIVAALSNCEPVDTTGGDNSFDAAIAEVSVEFDPEIMGIGRITEAPRPPALNLSVTKSGRTTGLTLGTIVDLAADITVDLQPGQANYVDQIGMQGIQNSMFSDGGDSGSLIVDAVEFAPVGLLFAGSPQQTFANPIQLVLQRFAAQIAA